MKKILALTMAMVLVLSLGACGKAPAAETKAPTEAPVSVTEKAAETEAARPHFDKLTLEFVPSKDADVIIAGTENLPELCRTADIVICAVGRAHAFGKEYFRAGQTVLDVGINFDSRGTLCGDVNFDEVEPVVDAITPVPGGIGTVTTSVTMAHVVDAAEKMTGR